MSRLQAICPYFAMFPASYAAEQIESWTGVGDYVLDPFSGRGTTLHEALRLGRKGVASDVNPVAYVLSGAKAVVPSVEALSEELTWLEADYFAGAQDTDLPEFFDWAFDRSTLLQLLYLRERLNWRQDSVHRFIAALVLGILHGESLRSRRYLSNQMPRTIATKPDYSVRYWRARGLRPPSRNVFAQLRGEIHFRLEGHVPTIAGLALLTDVRNVASALPHLEHQVRAVVTSPPYLDTTDFEEDQWLRLWFLGGPPHVTYGRVSRDDRHDSAARYWEFLAEAWRGVATLLATDAVISIRIGARGLDQEAIQEGLSGSLDQAFADRRLIAGPLRSRLRNRQTNAFRPGSVGREHEYDFTYMV